LILIGESPRSILRCRCSRKASSILG
jgi:hypothetical protein